MKKYNTPKDDIEQFINTFSKNKDSMGSIIGVEIWFDNLAHVVIPEKYIAYLGPTEWLEHLEISGK